LLENILKVSHTLGVMQVVLDSKHLLLMNNFPITAFGILDAGLQFNLIDLAVSNKEDEKIYTSFLKSIQSQLLVSFGTLLAQCLTIVTLFKMRFKAASL
jgi:hypothetical protein